MRHHKYNAQKTVCLAGHRHDSKKEAWRCDELHQMLFDGKIEGLEIQYRVQLLAACKYPKIGDERALCYVADFKYRRCNDGVIVVEDVKGMKTPEYTIKRKLFKHLFCRTGEVEFYEI